MLLLYKVVLQYFGIKQLEILAYTTRKPDETHEAIAFRCWRRKMHEVSPMATPAGISRPECRKVVPKQSLEVLLS